MNGVAHIAANAPFAQFTVASGPGIGIQLQHPVHRRLIHRRVFLRGKSLPRLDENPGAIRLRDLDGAITRSRIHHNDFALTIAHQWQHALEGTGEILFLVLRNQNDREAHAWKDTSKVGETESAIQSNWRRSWTGSFDSAQDGLRPIPTQVESERVWF